MVQTIQHSPGQTVTIFVEVFNFIGSPTDGYLVPADGYTVPSVKAIYFPNLTAAAGYPATTIKLTTGLYYYKFTLPTGASSVGSYLVLVSWTDPNGITLKFQRYHIVVTAPFGSYSVSPG